jgi:hypothetical protein
MATILKTMKAVSNLLCVLDKQAEKLKELGNFLREV